jgi:hypothetical protein
LKRHKARGRLFLRAHKAHRACRRQGRGSAVAAAPPAVNPFGPPTPSSSSPPKVDKVVPLRSDRPHAVPEKPRKERPQSTRANRGACGPTRAVELMIAAPCSVSSYRMIQVSVGEFRRGAGGRAEKTRRNIPISYHAAFRIIMLIRAREASGTRIVMHAFASPARRSISARRIAAARVSAQMLFVARAACS